MDSSVQETEEDRTATWTITVTVWILFQVKIRDITTKNCYNNRARIPCQQPVLKEIYIRSWVFFRQKLKRWIETT